MVKHINLTDFSPQKTALINTVTRKIAANKFTTLNQDFDKDLKVDLQVIKDLIESITVRFRRAEIIYYSYLEPVDHSILVGAGTGLPYKLEIQFHYGTGTDSHIIEINDRTLYKEAIDTSFQHFILLFAALFESMVRLSELLVRKIVVHRPSNKPISSPLLHYIEFLKSLIKLGYRKPDSLYGCVLTHTGILDKLLIPINSLRNSFIHGFQTNLVSDGINYRVNPSVANTFSAGSPDLNIDAFSKLVLDNSKMFMSDMLEALILHIKHHSKSIPA